MTRLEKLQDRFISRPKDFTYNELIRLLKNFGHREQQGSGSRVVFTNEHLRHSIKLHRPHPGNILKKYQIDLVIQELKTKGLL